MIQATFAEDKRQGVLEFCQKDIVNYVAEIVLYKTPDTLSKWMNEPLCVDLVLMGDMLYQVILDMCQRKIWRPSLPESLLDVSLLFVIC